ncbi:hypothetical protein PR048_024101 [Dryococelus australis]|uniref:Uncharacterized protein n=1 Tax=Dryococelus australis TaxID=614101 RepID=A0ABQ9GVY3_9NEOP|nr:hypothetical protein PR048_024101 [Dryococelus australis]
MFIAIDQNIVGSCVVEITHSRSNGRGFEPRLTARVQCFAVPNSTTFESTLAERLACSPPTKAIWVQFPAGPLRIFACGNRAGRCRWSAGFLGDLSFPPHFHSGAAPYSPQSPTSALKTSILRAVQTSSLTQGRAEFRGHLGARPCDRAQLSIFLSTESSSPLGRRDYVASGPAHQQIDEARRPTNFNHCDAAKRPEIAPSTRDLIVLTSSVRVVCARTARVQALQGRWPRCSDYSLPTMANQTGFPAVLSWGAPVSSTTAFHRCFIPISSHSSLIYSKMWCLAERSACIPSRRTGFNPRPGLCHWSMGFLGDLPFPPPFNSGAAPYLPQSSSSALNTSLSLTSADTCGTGGATVAERLARSPPTKRTGFNPRPRHQIFASGNLAGRCRWSSGFLGDLPFPPPLHSGAAPFTLKSPSSALKTSLLRAAKPKSLHFTHSCGTRATAIQAAVLRSLSGKQVHRCIDWLSARTTAPKPTSTSYSSPHCVEDLSTAAESGDHHRTTWYGGPPSGGDPAGPPAGLEQDGPEPPLSFPYMRLTPTLARGPPLPKARHFEELRHRKLQFLATMVCQSVNPRRDEDIKMQLGGPLFALRLNAKMKTSRCSLAGRSSPYDSTPR